MLAKEALRVFCQESPVSVMFRGSLERIMSPAKMDAIFAKAAVRQKTGDLLFSSCVDVMALVVAKVRKSVHAAYRARAEQVGVSVRAFYDKLAGIEPQVSERMVRETANEIAGVIQHMAVARKDLLPGYEVRILDGNHLAGTEHRLKELRTRGAAALPGVTLCILDPQRQLVLDVIACEDGHASERALIPRVLDKVGAGECWVADRNFCTLDLLFGVAARQSAFVIRQHGLLVGELVGKRKRLGRAPTGVAYEQKLRITNSRGEVLELRRITLELDAPTRDGEMEIHVLSNLPQAVSGRAIATLYLDRWRIETAFMHLATVLRSEVNTLAYPDAALFGFCIGLLLYNVLALVQAAVRAAHGRKLKARKLSHYYLGDEIAGTYRGMMIVIPPQYWTQAFAHLTVAHLADRLVALAKKVSIQQFLTNPCTRNNPPPKRTSGKRGQHVSTHRLLQTSRGTNLKKC